MEEQLDPKQLAKFKRHVMVVALCFLAVVAMKIYMDRQISDRPSASDVETMGDVAVRSYEVEAQKGR